MPGGEGEGRLLAAEVGEHVTRLPLDVRFAVVLHYYEGRPHEEVARVLGCPTGTAASRIRRGLEQLRASLKVGAASVLTLVMVEEALAADARSPLGEAPVRPPVGPIVEAAARLARTALLVKGTLAALAAVLCATLAARFVLPSGGPAPAPAAPPALVAEADPGRAPATASRPDAGPAPTLAAATEGATEGGDTKPGSPPTSAAPAAADPDATPALRGRVVRAEDGAPVAGAVVLLHSIKDLENGGSMSSKQGPVETDREGRFTLPLVANPFLALFGMKEGDAGAETVLDLRADGRAPIARLLSREALAPEATTPGAAPIEIVMEEGGASVEVEVALEEDAAKRRAAPEDGEEERAPLLVRGRLRMREGDAWPRRIEALFHHERGSDMGGHDVRPGPDGAFTLALENVAPGTRGYLAIRPEGYAPVLFPETLLSAEGIDLEVPLDPGITLAGRVLAPDGTPLEGAKVSLSYAGAEQCEGGSDETDSAGRFTLRGVLPREVRIRAAHHRPPPAPGDRDDVHVSWEGRVSLDASGAREVGDIRLERVERPVTRGR